MSWSVPIARLFGSEIRIHVTFLILLAYGRRLVFGTGLELGFVYPLLQPAGVRINPVYLSTDGKLWLQFGSLKDKPVFGRWKNDES